MSDHSAAPMIRLENVSKVFETGRSDVHALNSVSLDIQPGSIQGIIGFSGAGKSTLVRCINLLEKPTSGRVFVEGRELTAMAEKELRGVRRRIGMIFQHFNLMRSRTVLSNVAFPLKGSGLSKAQKQEKVMQLLKLVGLEDRASAYPAQLSGGQKQRVAIARALATEPHYLLCDEATSALDPNTTRAILELLKDINRKLGVTIVIITHEMRVIDQICDRVAVIDKSHIVEIGKVSEVFTNPQSRIAQELILPEGHPTEQFTGGKQLRIVFDGNASGLPMISNLVLACQAPVNILFADTRNIDGAAYGHMILELPPDPRQREKIYAWLESNGIQFKKEAK